MSVRSDDLHDPDFDSAIRGRAVPLRDAFQAAHLTEEDLEAIVRYFEREALTTMRQRAWGNWRRRSARRFAMRTAVRTKGGRK